MDINCKWQDGQLSIRKWKEGDRVTLNIPMPVRFNQTINQVEANRGRIAITRGTLVYAAEEIDNGGLVQKFYLENIPDASQISEQIINEGLLENVVKIKLPARKVSDEPTQQAELQLIPYYAWNNRGEGSMIIWVSAH